MGGATPINVKGIYAHEEQEWGRLQDDSLVGCFHAGGRRSGFSLPVGPARAPGSITSERTLTGSLYQPLHHVRPLAVFGPYKVYLSGYYCYSFGPVSAAYSHQAEFTFEETYLSAMMETFQNENPSRCEMKIPVLSNMLPYNPRSTPRQTDRHTHNQIGHVSQPTSSFPLWQQCDLWSWGESWPNSVVSADLPCEFSGWSEIQWGVNWNSRVSSEKPNGVELSKGIKPNQTLPLAQCSCSSQRMKHSMRKEHELHKEGAATPSWEEQRQHFSSSSSKPFPHPCSWSSANAFRSWASFVLEPQRAGYTEKVRLCWENHRGMIRFSSPKEVGSSSLQTIDTF